MIELRAITARVALNCPFLLHESLFTLIFIQLLPRRHFLFNPFIRNKSAILHLLFELDLVIDDVHFLFELGIAVQAVHNSALLFF